MAEQLPKLPSFVDMQKMESDMARNESLPPTPPPEKFIPIKHRDIEQFNTTPKNQTTIPTAAAAITTSFTSQTPLQSIATNLKRLVWDDNEHIAALVEKYYKGDSANMARAIQQAADELLKESTLS